LRSNGLTQPMSEMARVKTMNHLSKAESPFFLLYVMRERAVRGYFLLFKGRTEVGMGFAR